MSRKNSADKRAPLLIVFEGPDGAGKTSMAKEVVRSLLEEGRAAEYFAFPGSEPGTLGELIYRLHHDPSKFVSNSLSPTSLQALHIASHIDALESRILPALALGKCVVLDRYWWSTLVYGRASGADEVVLQSLIDAEKACWKGIKPLTLLLLQGNSEKNTHRDDRRCLLIREYLGLEEQERDDYPIEIIDNNQPFSKSAKEIRRVVADYIRSTTSASLSKARSNSADAALLGLEMTRKSPLGFARHSPPKPTEAYDTYWRFAAERQSIFFRRLSGQPPPWTTDPVLAEYKFTNAYRAADRVSQYAIRYLAYQGDMKDEELFFRILLFKIFNRIDTWQLLVRELGTPRFSEFDYDRYDRVLTHAMERGEKIYSPAYIMPSGGPFSKHTKKHRMHLRLIERMTREGLPEKLRNARSMEDAFLLLRAYPTMGNFLAFQYLTDLNYSPLLNFSEMEFVVPGPGAHSGIRKCFKDFGDLSEADIIKSMADRQLAEFERLGLEFRSLWGRPLQLIDCQNLFCEVDKYARVVHPQLSQKDGRHRIKQKFQPTAGDVDYWFPPKWGLNDRISREVGHVPAV